MSLPGMADLMRSNSNQKAHFTHYVLELFGSTADEERQTAFIGSTSIEDDQTEEEFKTETT